MMAGYSGTPLVKKLGIKPGNSILFMNEPAHLFKLLGELPEEVSLVGLNHSGPVNFIHIFCRDLESLHAQLPLAKEKLDKNGMLWVSWIKKASKNYDWTITDQDVRDFGLLMG
ncbi:MAG: hypothetical protein MI700_00765, partial [Balneolales bacterium]|nr:hypothetical protein [Balneolales bacterium]